MNINDYINSTRFIKKYETFDYYHDMYNIITSTFDNKNIEYPELVVCYSTERTCEFVSINEKDYIIYDQYLGQSINMLNRIYFNSTDKYDSLTYAYKVLCEICHYSSKIELSKLLYTSYVLNKDNHISYKQNNNYAVRSEYTYFQEFFVLMHEVAHWLLSKKDKSQIIKIKRQQLIDHLFELKNIEDPHRTDNLLQDIDALFDNPFNSYKDYISLEEITKLNESIDLAGKNLYDKEMELVQHNDDFIEECICDDMACEYLIDIMKKRYNISTISSLKIIYMALQNLEILTILKTEALKKSRSEDIPLYLVELLLRNGQFRKYAPFLCNSLKNKDIKEIRENLTKTNIKFSRIIKDPILFLLSDILDKIEKLSIDNDPFISINDDEFNNLIRGL